jgi:hypothetical protein
MSQIYFLLGTILDKIHVPVAVGVLGFGKLWLPQWVYFTVLLITVALQAMLRDCPLNPLVAWLKKKHKPKYSYRKERGMVWMVYSRWPKAAPFLKFFFWQFFSLITLRMFA